MSEDEGLDSDSSGTEFRRRMARHRNRQAKEARVCYGSKITMSLQDPMPEYVDPELVKLIAQNAPFELDVFVRSLHNSKKRRVENGGLRKGAMKEGERRPQAVEAILSSVAERNNHLSARKCSHDVRQSCPERIWSDYYEKEESICRAKRKRPKSLDNHRLPPADRPLPNEVCLSMSDNKGIRELRGASPGASPEERVTSVGSSDEGSNWLEDDCLAPSKDDKFEVPSARAPQADGNDGDFLNAKPWRHGMRKCTRSVKDEKPPDPTCCKRTADLDSRKTTEVRKYMETKMLERRKEQQQLKAEADAAFAARKEQQRKLDLHRQAMSQSQAVSGKGRELTPRPAWVSEYSNLCEPPRPWSSTSGELSTYLPPPATPPQLEMVPLDLYATQFQHAEGHLSTPRVDGIRVQNAQPREKRRSKRVKGCSREVQRQLKYRKSQIMKEFLPNDSPVTRKARWKAKTKPRGRKLSSDEVLQLLEPDEAHLPRRSGDLEPYKRSLKRHFHSNGGSPPAAATRAQNSMSRFLPKTPIKSMRPPESCLRSASKDQVRPLSKEKRLKPTHQFIPCKAKELTGEELAPLLNANRVLSDRESETNVKVSGKVIGGRTVIRSSPTSPATEDESITDLRKCVGQSLGSPQRNTTDEDVLCKWLGPSLEHSEKHLIDEDVPLESRGELPSRKKGVQLQVVHFQKEKTGDTDVRRPTSKDLPLAVRWQRMQLLKNLAEQLVKRVDEACAKKHQLERSAVEQIDSPSMNIDSEPSEQLATAESGHVVDFLEAEPTLDHLPKLSNSPPPYIREPALEFFHQPKQNSILHCRELTEQEQAGCDTPVTQLDELQFKIKRSIVSSRRAIMSETADQKVAAGPVSEMCALMDWNASEKGSSSPSTGSSSPVILPTNTRFHMGRIKHSKIVVNEERAQQAKKEDWIIPAENDTYSIFNVYTQHLKDRGKLGTSTSPSDVQNDVEDRTAVEMEIDPGIAAPAAQEDKSTLATIPLSQKLTISELPVGLPELMSIRTVQSADCSQKNTVSPDSDGTGPDVEKNQIVFSSNFQSLQQLRSSSEKAAVRPGAELNNLKTDGIELAGTNPEGTILEIGDLKLFQSPTSFHLRLDRCKDIREDGKAREKNPTNVSHLRNVGNCAEPSSSTCVGSRKETRELCVGNLIPPMKITYARRVNSKARPDGGCTDDEKVVVELHQMNARGPPVPLQGETRLDCPELDASEEAPRGMTSPQLNIVVGNAQSENLEGGALKLGTINGDFKQGYMLSKPKGSVALRPTIDRVSDHDNFGAFVGETGSPSCREGKLDVETSHNKRDLQIDLRDSQEWELKLRRDQLEAELQKLDAEIRKTRARLHQRHSVIDRQLHSVSVSSSAEQPVESPSKLDKPPMQSTKHMVDKERHTVVFHISPDLQTQNIATAHLVPKPRRDAGKTVTRSDSYADSFVSADSESGQKIPGTGKCDFTDRPQSRITTSLCDKSFRAPKTGIQQFEALLDRPRGNQSNAETTQGEAQSYWKMPSAQDDYPSEGSEISTGRGPGRILDKPPHLDGDESTARFRTPKVRFIPVISDQMVEVDVGAVETCAKDERNLLESRSSCIRDEPRGAVNTTYNSWRALGTPIDSIPQEEKTSRVEGQVPLQQNGGIFEEKRQPHALPESGTGEGLSSVDQYGSQKAENSKPPMTLEGNSNSSATTGGEISTLNTTPPCIQQNGWPMEGKEGNGAPWGTTEVLSSSIDEQKEGKISHEAVLSTARASDNGDGQASTWGVGKVSQTNGEQVETIRNAVASIQNSKTSLSGDDSRSIVAAEEVSCPPHPMGGSQECIPVLPRSSPCVSQESESPTENPAQALFHGSIVHLKVGNGQTETFDGRKGSTCSPEDKPSGDVATTVPHFVPPASLTSANPPCGSTTKETDWQCLSLLSHLDFSTIREKLRNNKLAGDEQPITDDWANYQSKTLKSPSPTPFSTGGDSFGSQTVASERTFASDVLRNSTNICEHPGSLLTSNIGGDSSEGQTVARDTINTIDFPHTSNKIYENASPSCSKTGGDSAGEQTVVNERIVTSDVPKTLQDHKNSTSLEAEQTGESKYLPEMETNQENGFLPVLSPSTSTNIRAAPNDQPFDAQGSTMPVSSTSELPRFLPSLYFQQQMTKSDPSEEAESTISEDLENYESDIDEDMNDDAEGPSSGHFEVIANWKTSSPLPSNTFISSNTLAVGTPNIQVFHSESGFGVTSGPTFETGDVFKRLSTDCIDQDLKVGRSEPSGATGPSSPSKVSLGQSDNRLSLHTRDSYEALPATCTSPGSGDGEVIETLKSITNTMTEDSSLREFSRVSEDYYCRSEVSGSQAQSESISEDVHFGDNATSSIRSGSDRGNIHRVDLVEWKTREDNNEGDTQNSVDDRKDYPWNNILPSRPRKPDFIDNGDRQHSVDIARFTTTSVIRKEDPDDNSFPDSVSTVDCQERARSRDDSQHHPVLLGSHVEPESSRPVEFPMSFIVPPLRSSEDSGQHNDNPLSNVSRVRRLSAMDSQFGETLGKDEEHSLKSVYRPEEMESAFNRVVTWTPLNPPPESVSSPGDMVKPATKPFHCKEGTICDWEARRVEHNPIPVEKTRDQGVFGLSSHQIRLLETCDANFSVDGARSVDCNSENSLPEELEKAGLLSDENDNLSNTSRAADTPSGNETATTTIVGEEANESVVADCSHEISGPPVLGLEKVPYQDEESLLVSIPLDCDSHCASTFVAKDTPVSCLSLTSTSEEKQLPIECRITRIESNRSFASFHANTSNGGPSAHQVAPANRDFLSLSETGDTRGPQNISSVRHDKISPLQFRKSNTVIGTAPLLGHQQLATDVDKDTEDMSYSRQINLEYNRTKTTRDIEGHIAQMYSPVCSLEALQPDLRSQHGTMSASPTHGCSSKEGFLTRSAVSTGRTKLPAINVLPKLPRAEDVASSAVSCSFNELLNSAQENMDKQRSLLYTEEKDQSRCCEIHEEDAGSVSSKLISSSGVPEEQLISKTCLLTLQEDSRSFVTSSTAQPNLCGKIKNIKLQMEADRAEKLNIMADLVTSMVYEELLSVELCGFHHEAGRTPMFMKTSRQRNQTLNSTKTFSPKLKRRSRKISEFCQVLKHFLPTGWRSASVRHKTGLFLHVEGLRPYPINPVTSDMPGTSKYPSYPQSEHGVRTANSEILLLDMNDLYTYVQKSCELSSLILDPSPANWYDPKKPVGEHVFMALDSQFSEISHIVENSRWKIQKSLISDLINETLLKQFATKLLVPSLGTKTLPLPSGGESLVQFVANGIVENERCASKHGFDIEKVIAKAFEDEHWEKCSEEAREVVGDLAKDILGDMLERFVYQMVRGWCYHSTEFQDVLAS